LLLLSLSLTFTRRRFLPTVLFPKGLTPAGGFEFPSQVERLNSDVADSDAGVPNSPHRSHAPFRNSGYGRLR